MRHAEKCLLIACRERLRLPQNVSGGGGGYSDKECEIEFDELAPATVGQVYVAVMPGGWRPGPRHNTSGGCNDLVYSVNVAVARRIGNVPRDRRRDLFLENLGNLDEELDRVFLAIDFRYELTKAANARILAETGSSEGFIEPLRLVGEVRRPRPVGPEFFGAAGQGEAALMRVIPFGGARRITTKS